MNQIVIGSRLQKAIDKIKDMGLSLSVPDVAPMTKIIEKIEDADKDRAIVIARTLSAMQSFDSLVAENLQSTRYGERFDTITEGFNSIIEDLRRQVEQENNGGAGLSGRFSNVVMKLTRGDVADRFVKIESTYKSVIQDASNTLERQSAILEAYADARSALKEGEIAAIEIFEKVTASYNAAKATLEAMNERIRASETLAPADKGRLELERDDSMTALRREEDRYSIAKQLSEMMTVSYSVTETIFGKYHQAHKVLERLYQKAVVFFEVQRPVMTAMKATYTGLMVVNELSKTQQAMEDGLNKSIEVLATLGDSALRQGVKIAHGTTLKASSVAMLVDSIVEFQVFVQQAVQEGDELATKDTEAMRAKVEDGKRKMAEFAASPSMVMA
jgi:hypothetical protein